MPVETGSTLSKEVHVKGPFFVRTELELSVWASVWHEAYIKKKKKKKKKKTHGLFISRLYNATQIEVTVVSSA